jgi:hypothetical protein
VQGNSRYSNEKRELGTHASLAAPGKRICGLWRIERGCSNDYLWATMGDGGTPGSQAEPGPFYSSAEGAGWGIGAGPRAGPRLRPSHGFGPRPRLSSFRDAVPHLLHALTTLLSITPCMRLISSQVH